MQTIRFRFVCAADAGKSIEIAFDRAPHEKTYTGTLNFWDEASRKSDGFNFGEHYKNDQEKLLKTAQSQAKAYAAAHTLGDVQPAF